MDRLLSMRVFESVIDHGSFAAAARVLDLSAAGVTRLITDLEAHLKTRLLHRTTRRLALTDAGETYLKRVRAILREVDDADAEATATTVELSGAVRVAATPILASLVVAPALSHWHRQQPKISIELVIDPFPQDRIPEFDLTLFIVDEGYDANVIASPLLSSDYVVCASPEYLARNGTPKQPSELADHGYLRFPWPTEEGPSRQKLRLRRVGDRGTTESVEVQMPVVLESLSHLALHQAAVDGAGIVVLSKALIASDLGSARLVQILPEWIFGRFTAFVAMPSRELIPKRTRAFLEILHEFVRTEIAEAGALRQFRLTRASRIKKPA